MKLYTFDIAPNPQRLALFLRHKGIDIETEQVDLGSGAQFSEAYKAINPASTVPTLVLDDGSIMTEVVEILVYLEALYPERPLLGSSDLIRARTIGWIHKLYLSIFMGVAEALRNQGDAFKNRALPGALDMPQIPELVDRGRLKIESGYQMMNEHLGKNDFVAGAEFTQADIDFHVVTGFSKWVKMSVPESATAIHAWQQRVAEKLA